MKYLLFFFTLLTIHYIPCLSMDYTALLNNDSSIVSVNILKTNIFSFTNAISLDDINKHFSSNSDGLLDQNDKAELFDKFTDNSKVAGFIEVTPLSLSYKISDFRIDFSIKDLAYFDFKIPKHVPEILLYGNNQNKHYNVDKFSFKSAYFRKYTLGTSTYFNNLPTFDIFPENSELGINISYIQGYSYVNARVSSSDLFTDQYNRITGYVNIEAQTAFSRDFGVNHDYANTEYASNFGLLNKPAGTGVSFDIYWKSFYLDSAINFKIGLYDIGTITWNDNTGLYWSNSDFLLSDIFNEAQIDSLENAFDFQSRENNFTVAAPASFKASISADINNYVEIPFLINAQLNYYQALNSTFYNDYTPKFSFILENSFVQYLPSLGIGICNNFFNIIEFPLFISFRNSYFDGLLGVRDFVSFLSNSYDNISIVSSFTFYIN